MVPFTPSSPTFLTLTDTATTLLSLFYPLYYFFIAHPPFLTIPYRTYTPPPVNAIKLSHLLVAPSLSMLTIVLSTLPLFHTMSTTSHLSSPSLITPYRSSLFLLIYFRLTFPFPSDPRSPCFTYSPLPSYYSQPFTKSHSEADFL